MRTASRSRSTSRSRGARDGSRGESRPGELARSAPGRAQCGASPPGSTSRRSSSVRSRFSASRRTGTYGSGPYRCGSTRRRGWGAGSWATSPANWLHFSIELPPDLPRALEGTFVAFRWRVAASRRRRVGHDTASPPLLLLEPRPLPVIRVETSPLGTWRLLEWRAEDERDGTAEPCTVTRAAPSGGHAAPRRDPRAGDRAPRSPLTPTRQRAVRIITPSVRSALQPRVRRRSRSRLARVCPECRRPRACPAESFVDLRPCRLTSRRQSPPSEQLPRSATSSANRDLDAPERRRSWKRTRWDATVASASTESIRRWLSPSQGGRVSRSSSPPHARATRRPSACSAPCSSRSRSTARATPACPTRASATGIRCSFWRSARRQLSSPRGLVTEGLFIRGGRPQGRGRRPGPTG